MFRAIVRRSLRRSKSFMSIESFDVMELVGAAVDLADAASSGPKNCCSMIGIAVLKTPHKSFHIVGFAPRVCLTSISA